LELLFCGQNDVNSLSIITRDIVEKVELSSIHISSIVSYPPHGRNFSLYLEHTADWMDDEMRLLFGEISPLSEELE